MNPIRIDPEIMHGTPCFAGTRVPVKNLLDYVRKGHPLAEFLRQFPTVTAEQANAVFERFGEQLTAMAEAA